VARKWVARLLVFYDEQLAPGPDQWPEIGTEDYQSFEQIWDEALSDEAVDDKQAFASVRKLCKENHRPKWRSEHLPGLLEMVRRTKAANLAQGAAGKLAGPEESRESALYKSLACDYCGRTGMTLVYHRDHVGGRMIEVYDRNNELKKVASSVAAWCVCPLGRWIRINHQRKDKDLAKRMVDLCNVVDGNSEWCDKDSSTPQLPRGVVPRIQEWRALAEIVRVPRQSRVS
jgi:hypothetical protein